MKEFRLYWASGFNGEPNLMPPRIAADRYEYRMMEHMVLLEFFIGDEVIASFTNLPQGITIDEGITPSSIPQ